MVFNEIFIEFVSLDVPYFGKVVFFRVSSQVKSCILIKYFFHLSIFKKHIHIYCIMEIHT